MSRGWRWAFVTLSHCWQSAEAERLKEERIAEYTAKKSKSALGCQPSCMPVS